MLPFLVLLATTSGDGGREAEQRLPSLEEAEKRMLDARRMIRRGILRFSCTTKEKDAPAGTIDYSVWFDLDADKCRIDRVRRGNASIGRQIQGRNCERDGYGVDYWDLRAEKGVTMLTLAPLARLKDELSLFDARLLGFVVAGPEQYRHLNLESHLASPDRIKPEVRRDSLDGVPCLVVSFARANGNRMRVWGDPAKGDSVVRIELENPQKDGALRASVENRMKLDEASGIWFPETSSATFDYSGHPPENVIVKVESARFNVPIDEGVFTLAGMDLRQGLVIRRVSEDGKATLFNWKGEEMEKWKRPSYTIPPPAPVPSSAWLYWVAGGLGAAALVALVLWYRRRPA